MFASQLRQICFAEINDGAVQDVSRGINAKSCMAPAVKQVQSKGAAICVFTTLANTGDELVLHQYGDFAGLDIKQFADQRRIEDEIVTVAFDILSGIES